MHELLLRQHCLLGAGYRSVAHYLVLTKQASAAQPAEAEEPAAAQSAPLQQPAECLTEEGQPDVVPVDPVTSAGTSWLLFQQCCILPCCTIMVIEPCV